MVVLPKGRPTSASSQRSAPSARPSPAGRRRRRGRAGPHACHRRSRPSLPSLHPVRRALARHSSSACSSGSCCSRWSPSWWCLGGRPTPTPWAVSGGGPPLKFHETRDNLQRPGFPLPFSRRHLLLGLSYARWGSRPSSRSAYRTATGLDLNGVITFHLYETRPGRVPPQPRERRCSHDRIDASGRRLPLRNGQFLHPGTATITRGSF